MRVHTLTSACSLSVFCSVIGVLPSPMYNTLYQQQALWNNLLAHFKSRDVLVEGPIDALRPYLMNLSKPRPLKKKVRRAQPAHTGEPAHDYCVHACVCMRVCVGRQADTDRHRHTHTDTDRHRHTHTHAHTRTRTHKHRHRHRHRHAHTNTHTHTPPALSASYFVPTATCRTHQCRLARDS